MLLLFGMLLLHNNYLFNLLDDFKCQVSLFTLKLGVYWKNGGGGGGGGGL